MAELIAIGKGAQRQSRLDIHDGDEVLLGRAPRNGWAVPWDRLISREHARLRMHDGRLAVSELETARNPIFFNGQPAKAFTLDPECVFRIGDTTFHFRTEVTQREGDSIITEHVFEDEPSGSPFTNPIACLQALCKMPALIGQSSTNEELAEQAVELLLDSLSGSSAAAVIQLDTSGDSLGEPQLVRWSSRGDEVARFRPSRRLVQRAFERQQSVVHLWLDDDLGPSDSNFTMNDDLDWAFCTPILVGVGRQWCLYVSGRRRFAGVREVRSPKDLIGELRLAELMAQFIGAIRRVRTLEQQQTEMRQFFSPAVIETLTGAAADDALEPRLGPITALFCDVRGFSRKVEEAGGDLPKLLGQVSQALSVMTRGILKQEGVVADFQGDAALGFWGWPSHSPEAALLACRAALGIHAEFHRAESDPQSPLHGFRVGLGLTFGDAIAGRIGSAEQIKVGAFGPSVNLASRLQDLTKQMGVPILVDEGVAREVGDTLPADIGFFRRLARLRPAGMNLPTDVYALVPADPAQQTLDADGLAAYDRAVDAIIAGDWPAAGELLGALPETDPPTVFLRTLLANSRFAPPADWDGALAMAGKGEVRLRST